MNELDGLFRDYLKNHASNASERAQAKFDVKLEEKIFPMDAIFRDGLDSEFTKPSYRAKSIFLDRLESSENTLDTAFKNSLENFSSQPSDKAKDLFDKKLDSNDVQIDSFYAAQFADFESQPSLNAFENFKRRLEKEDIKKPVFFTNSRKYFAAAASVLLLLGIGWNILLKVDTSDSVSSAKLTIPNNLEKSTNKSIAINSNQKIEKRTQDFSKGVGLSIDNQVVLFDDNSILNTEEKGLY
ncbi:MAG: hypothetical protein ACRCVT_12930, partial [Leadbetterella sp.]